MKDAQASNVFVTDLLAALSPAKTYRTAAKPLALAGHALDPVPVIVPLQPVAPLAPVMGAPFRSQFQDTLPPPLPLQSKVHEADVWAEAEPTTNAGKTRAVIARAADSMRGIRTPPNLLRVLDGARRLGVKRSPQGPLRGPSF